MGVVAAMLFSAWITAIVLLVLLYAMGEFGMGAFG